MKVSPSVWTPYPLKNSFSIRKIQFSHFKRAKNKVCISQFCCFKFDKIFTFHAKTLIFYVLPPSDRFKWLGKLIKTGVWNHFHGKFHVFAGQNMLYLYYHTKIQISPSNIHQILSFYDKAPLFFVLISSSRVKWLKKVFKTGISYHSLGKFHLFARFLFQNPYFSQHMKIFLTFSTLFSSFLLH